jgi:hypothetical protein
VGIQKYLSLEIQRIIMVLAANGIDTGIVQLQKGDLLSQQDFIKWLLKRNKRMFTSQMYHNWNFYKINILGHKGKCSYNGFRRVVWQLKENGFLVAGELANPNPRTLREKLFGQTYYYLARL